MDWICCKQNQPRIQWVNRDLAYSTVANEPLNTRITLLDHTTPVGRCTKPTRHKFAHSFVRRRISCPFSPFPRNHLSSVDMNEQRKWAPKHEDITAGPHSLARMRHIPKVNLDSLYLVLNRNSSWHCLILSVSISDKGGWIVGWFDRICPASDDPSEWAIRCCRVKCRIECIFMWDIEDWPPGLASQTPDSEHTTVYIFDFCTRFVSTLSNI